MCLDRDVLVGIVSIHEAGHTYKGWGIQSKCGYPCLSPNGLLRIAVCSARNALLGNAVIQSMPFGVEHVAI